jgi:hypothetical protein
MARKSPKGKVAEKNRETGGSLDKRTPADISNREQNPNVYGANYQDALIFGSSAIRICLQMDPDFAFRPWRSALSAHFGKSAEKRPTWWPLRSSASGRLCFQADLTEVDNRGRPGLDGKRNITVRSHVTRLFRILPDVRGPTSFRPIITC